MAADVGDDADSVLAGSEALSQIRDALLDLRSAGYEIDEQAWLVASGAVA